jgi:outer membrane lipoprotein-sorting protein
MIVGSLMLFASTAVGEDWTLNDALKQTDKATKGLRGLSGEATVTDHRDGEDAAELSGEVSIRTDGRVRIELTGDTPKTILCIPGKMFVHEPDKSIVVEYPLAKYPEKLAQYTLVGFSTRGPALKKDFLPTLVGEDEIDGRSVVLLELTPKSDALRSALSKIQLWVDQSSWLPVQQRFFHGGMDTHLTVRYSNLSRNDNLSNDLFAPKWPKGTKKQKP